MGFVNRRRPDFLRFAAFPFGDTLRDIITALLWHFAKTSGGNIEESERFDLYLVRTRGYLEPFSESTLKLMY